MGLLHDVVRIASLTVLSRFRTGFCDCQTARADGLFELADAVVCTDGPVLGLGLVVALEDLIATQVWVLGDGGLPRDVIGVHAVFGQFGSGGLEALGARRPEEFDVRELRDRLESVAWVSDAGFEAYGLEPARIAELRHWAQRWQDDLAQRLAGPFTDGDDVGGY